MIKIDWLQVLLDNNIIRETRRQNTTSALERGEEFWLVTWYIGSIELWTTTAPWGYRKHI